MRSAKKVRSREVIWSAYLVKNRSFACYSTRKGIFVNFRQTSSYMNCTSSSMNVYELQILIYERV